MCQSGRTCKRRPVAAHALACVGTEAATLHGPLPAFKLESIWGEWGFRSPESGSASTADEYRHAVAYPLAHSSCRRMACGIRFLFVLFEREQRGGTAK